jgi:sec-independent protein translocase protein TatA
MFRNPYADTLIVLLVVLLFLGPKRLPMLGRSLGQGLREFKDSITGDSKGDDEDDERPELTQASATPAEAQSPSSASTPAATPADHVG